MSIKKRSKKALNLDQYSKKNKLDKIGPIDTKCPWDRQYILRMIVKEPFSNYQIPRKLTWISPFLEKAKRHQENIGVRQPFCHITVRHGKVTSKKDDEWHVDGFSMNVTHLPEQNYIWVNSHPTEYIERTFDIPKDFDPQKHNIHLLFQDLIDEDENIKTLEPEILYCIDPYIVHRRPEIPTGIERTFVRISFCPMEIKDVNNTQNPLMPRNYKRDGVEEFRESLERYPVKN